MRTVFIEPILHFHVFLCPLKREGQDLSSLKIGFTRSAMSMETGREVPRGGAFRAMRCLGPPQPQCDHEELFQLTAQLRIAVLVALVGVFYAVEIEEEPGAI